MAPAVPAAPDSAAGFPPFVPPQAMASNATVLINPTIARRGIVIFITKTLSSNEIMVIYKQMIAIGARCA
jgi:hypothetical protein